MPSRMPLNPDEPRAPVAPRSYSGMPRPTCEGFWLNVDQNIVELWLESDNPDRPGLVRDSYIDAAWAAVETNMAHWRKSVEARIGGRICCG